MRQWVMNVYRPHFFILHHLPDDPAADAAPLYRNVLQHVFRYFFVFYRNVLHVFTCRNMPFHQAVMIFWLSGNLA